MNEIDLDKIDMMGSPPEHEPERQYYFMAKCREWVREFEQKKSVTEDCEIQSITDINKLRSCMFLETEKELINSPAECIYFLEAPTGSGKSNMALNLSFQFSHGIFVQFQMVFQAIQDTN